MEYRRIGSLSVPVVGLGCNQFATAACDEATSIAIIHEAIDAGITYFDVADEYGQNYADPTERGGWAPPSRSSAGRCEAADVTRC